ncbi:MAG: hypothetical protein AAF993_18540, partial [Pseudomonadota bacterium]
ENKLAEYKALGVSIVAGTVDTEEQTLDVARDLSFPVAYGMTIADAEAVGAKWEPRRDHIQPAEFIMRGDGTVMASTYSNSPVGRMDPAETLVLLQFLDSRAKQKG